MVRIYRTAETVAWTTDVLFAGGAAYYYLNWFKSHQKPFFLGACLLLTTNVLWGFNIGYPLALSIAVISLGFFIPYLGKFGKHGDFSYGIYILHFPILQTLFSLGLFHEHWAGFLLATISVLVMAYFSMAFY